MKKRNVIRLFSGATSLLFGLTLYSCHEPVEENTRKDDTPIIAVHESLSPNTIEDKIIEIDKNDSFENYIEYAEPTEEIAETTSPEEQIIKNSYRVQDLIIVTFEDPTTNQKKKVLMKLEDMWPTSPISEKEYTAFAKGILSKTQLAPFIDETHNNGFAVKYRSINNPSILLEMQIVTSIKLDGPIVTINANYQKQTLTLKDLSIEKVHADINLDGKITKIKEAKLYDQNGLPQDTEQDLTFTIENFSRMFNQTDLEDYKNECLKFEEELNVPHSKTIR